MDISELFPQLIGALILIAALKVFHSASRVTQRWLRVTLKIVSPLISLVALVIVFLTLLFEAACSKHTGPIKAPDGRHVAFLTYALQGALGDDYADVKVRASWSPKAQIAYSGLGTWDFKNDKPYDPDIRWIDSSHLLINHRDARTGKEGRGGPAICASRIGEVEIVCQLLPSAPD